MMRFAGYDKDIMTEANVDAFMEQALEYKNLVDNNAWNKTLEFLLFRNDGHPLNVIRIYEGKKWGETERYKNILDYMNLDISDAESKLPVEVFLKKMIGKNVADIQTKFLSMGFVNVNTVRHTEVKKTKDGSVIAITINESIEDGWYKCGDEVKIEYFEAKTDEEIALEHLGEIRIGENQKYFFGTQL